MIDGVPLIQNANDAQQINASIIAMKKASRELDEKIVKLNSLNSELDKKIALLDSGLNKEIEDRKEAINSLDVPSVGGSGKYISAISEADGKISATASDITSSVSSGNSQPVTSGGVAEALNNPLIKTFSNNVASNKIIHLGHFTIPSNFVRRCGLNIEVEVKRADGSYRILGSIYGQTLKIGVFDVSSGQFDLYFYKTNDNSFDLYLFIGTYIEQVFVKMTEPLYFTYDGSIVTSYAGTKINPIYSNSTDSVTNGSLLPVTSGGVYAELQKRNPAIITFQNNTGNVKYFKISNILADLSWGDAVYLLESRAGELLLISVGHGDGVTVPPKAKRLLDVYTKISGIAYMNNSRNLYIRVAAWSHELVLTRLTSYGMNDPALSIVQEITVNEYSSATAITIET